MNSKEQDRKSDTCIYYHARVNLQNPLMSLAEV